MSKSKLMFCRHIGTARPVCSETFMQTPQTPAGRIARCRRVTQLDLCANNQLHRILAPVRHCRPSFLSSLSAHTLRVLMLRSAHLPSPAILHASDDSSSAPPPAPCYCGVSARCCLLCSRLPVRLNSCSVLPASNPWGRMRKSYLSLSFVGITLCMNSSAAALGRTVCAKLFCYLITSRIRRPEIQACIPLSLSCTWHTPDFFTVAFRRALHDHILPFLLQPPSFAPRAPRWRGWLLQSPAFWQCDSPHTLTLETYIIALVSLVPPLPLLLAYLSRHRPLSVLVLSSAAVVGVFFASQGSSPPSSSLPSSSTFFLPGVAGLLGRVADALPGRGDFPIGFPPLFENIHVRLGLRLMRRGTRHS
jgi:hypothetical protein